MSSSDDYDYQHHQSHFGELELLGLNLFYSSFYSISQSFEFEKEKDSL